MQDKMKIRPCDVCGSVYLAATGTLRGVCANGHSILLSQEELRRLDDFAYECAYDRLENLMNNATIKDIKTLRDGYLALGPYKHSQHYFNHFDNLYHKLRLKKEEAKRKKAEKQKQENKIVMKWVNRLRTSLGWLLILLTLLAVGVFISACSTVTGILPYIENAQMAADYTFSTEVYFSWWRALGFSILTFIACFVFVVVAIFIFTGVAHEIRNSNRGIANIAMAAITTFTAVAIPVLFFSSLGEPAAEFANFDLYLAEAGLAFSEPLLRVMISERGAVSLSILRERSEISYSMLIYGISVHDYMQLDYPIAEFEEALSSFHISYLFLVVGGILVFFLLLFPVPFVISVSMIMAYMAGYYKQKYFADKELCYDRSK